MLCGRSSAGAPSILCLSSVDSLSRLCRGSALSRPRRSYVDALSMLSRCFIHALSVLCSLSLHCRCTIDHSTVHPLSVVSPFSCHSLYGIVFLIPLLSRPVGSSVVSLLSLHVSLPCGRAFSGFLQKEDILGSLRRGKFSGFFQGVGEIFDIFGR